MDQSPPAKKRRDSEFNADEEDSTDDEATIAEQEAHEKVKRDVKRKVDSKSDEDDSGPSAHEAKEVSQLEAEAEMSLEELLARYGISSEQLNKSGEQDRSRATSETFSATDSGSNPDSDSDRDDECSSSTKDSSDSGKENEDEEDVEMEEPGLEELLSEDEKENLAKSNSSMPEVS